VTSTIFILKAHFGMTDKLAWCPWNGGEADDQQTDLIGKILGTWTSPQMLSIRSYAPAATGGAERHNVLGRIPKKSLSAADGSAPG
jgi:hypothetical protein